MTTYCLYCEGDFKSYNNVQKYCSRECRGKHYREREQASLARVVAENVSEWMGAPADIYTAAEYALLVDAVNVVLSKLTDRQRKVLMLRFGIGDGYYRTLEECGSAFNLSRERIREIEARGLRELRHPARSSLLKEFALL